MQLHFRERRKHFARRMEDEDVTLFVISAQKNKVPNVYVYGECV
jgi:hypothetical protein